LPRFAKHLPYDKLLVDLTVLNFLDDESRPERSLKALCRLLGVARYDEKAMLARSGESRYPSADDPALAEYNAQDSHNTAAAVAILTQRFMEREPARAKVALSNRTLAFYSDLIWSCLHMIEAGIPMSRNALESLHAKCAAELEASRKELIERHNIQISGAGSSITANAVAAPDTPSLSDDLAKPKSRIQWIEESFRAVPSSMCRNVFNVDSPDDIPLLKYTKTGFISTDRTNRAVLKSLRPDLADAIDAWDRHDNAKSLITRYLDPLLRDHTSTTIDNRSCAVHVGPDDPDLLMGWPSIFIVPAPEKHGRASGGQRHMRCSFKRPAAQTFPPVIKACMRSPWPDGFIVSYDFSQIDLRVAALLSGDETLVRNYKEGRDLHADRAISIFGKDIVNDPNFGCGDMSCDPRQWAKRINFSDLYLSGPHTMQKNLYVESGVLFPLDFFRRIVDERKLLRPGLTAWQQSLLREAGRTGRVWLPLLGQARTFATDNTTPHKSEIVNFPVQSEASLTTMSMQIAVHKRLTNRGALHPAVRMFLNVHDANYFVVASRDAYDNVLKPAIDDAFEELTTTGHWSDLQRHYGHDVPLAMSISVPEPAEAVGGGR